jgi:hypothetical protein
MKKYLIIIFLFPIVGISQTYEITTQTKGENYNAYTGTGMTTSVSTIQQTKTSADYFQDAQNNIIQAKQANAQREAQRENTQAIIDNQNRIENQRIQEQKKKHIEQERIEEEKDPNSILNKFKNANLKQENEDLKSKLLQMEILLAEKEKAEKERTEKENTQKKNSKKNK